MYFKLIGCDVFTRELCLAVASSPHTVDLDFTEKGSHDNSERLHTLIQEKIDAADESGKGYDAVLLGYGLCGNSTRGLSSKSSKLVIPRAHDCCTIFLGSKQSFKEHFAENPSRQFTSAGYMERGEGYLKTSTFSKEMGIDKSYEEYVELYGEENARYIMETLDPSLKGGNDDSIIYIEVPETEVLDYKQRCREEAEREGKEFLCISGNIRLLKDMIHGNWNDDDFLVLEPEERIVPVYDWNEIIRKG
jgi:hypothetical protein